MPSVGLPVWGRERPALCAVRGNASGTAQFYVWDLATGAFRQLTDAPHGVELGLVDPRGRRLWWYRDDDGAEQGHWVRSPLRGGPAVPALPGMPGGTPEGLALGRSGLAVAGVGEPAGGYGLYAMRPGARAAEPLRLSSRPLYVGGISDDETLVLYVHAERGDPQRPALRVTTLDGTTVADLGDWPTSGIEVAPFSSPFRPGGHQILATHERHGVRAPLLWDPHTGEVQEIATGLTGEVRAQFYPDGRALLLHHRHQGRSQLLRHTLADGRTTLLPTPPGTVHEVAARPDGGHWYTFSAADTAPVLYDDGGAELLTVPRAVRPASPVRALHADGPGGAVPAYVSAPTGQGERRPDGTAHPAVFLLHGGPHAADGDAYLPEAAAWNDAGYTVVRVNYRGSGDHGRAWRLAHRAAVGHTELADVAAVRARLVADGLVDPGRCVLAGAPGAATSSCSASAPSRRCGPAASPRTRSATTPPPTRRSSRGCAGSTAPCSAAAPPKSPASTPPRPRSPTRTRCAHRCWSWPPNTTRAARPGRWRTTSPRCAAGAPTSRSTTARWGTAAPTPVAAPSRSPRRSPSSAAGSAPGRPTGKREHEREHAERGECPGRPGRAESSGRPAPPVHGAAGRLRLRGQARAGHGPRPGHPATGREADAKAGAVSEPAADAVTVPAAEAVPVAEQENAR